jgi:NAD(P)H-nitrite reductase large subunit
MEPLSQHLLCRCEEIGADEIRRAVEAGARTVNDVKRQTRAGMGVCQGIYCVAEIAKMLVTPTGTTPGEVGPLTARPPVRLLPLGSLAGIDPDDR